MDLILNDRDGIAVTSRREIARFFDDFGHPNHHDTRKIDAENSGIRSENRPSLL
jgi:hypothetical protein